jgi:hypothetical protein
MADMAGEPGREQRQPVATAVKPFLVNSRHPLLGIGLLDGPALPDRAIIAIEENLAAVSAKPPAIRQRQMLDEPCAGLSSTAPRHLKAECASRVL